MKRTTKTIIAASLIALLAACGGGSDAQSATSVVNPTKVIIEQSTEAPQYKPDDSSKERAFGNAGREILMSAKRPTVYEIVRAYHTMVAYVSSGEQRDMTNTEENDLDRLEIWFWLRWGLLQQSGETMTTKERLNKTKQDMIEMRKNFSMREYVGRIMSAVYPAMLVNPDSWAEAVETYNTMAATAK
jgi:hypothetical protein|nr:MAG TPA: protein of unknown function (DUF4969) [Caudoviricetes sp.]